MSNEDINKVLIMEDSKPDRLRMRMLLGTLGVPFKFAWNSIERSMLPIIDENDPNNHETIIEENNPNNHKTIFKLMEKIKPEKLVIDLAWTTNDEKNLSKLCFLNEEEIIKERKENDSKENDSKENNSKRHEWISGISFIEKLNEKKDSKDYEFIKKIDNLIIVTQFAQPITIGLNAYLKSILDKKWDRYDYIIVHKWREQHKFLRKIVY